jgi:hypothetical protein
MSMDETLYFLQYGDGPVTEVTMEEFVQAERAAGFHNTMGEPDRPATAGFSGGNVRGTVRYAAQETPSARLNRLSVERLNERYRFEGRQPRECGEHHSVGSRAWCFDDSEWCSGYPEGACRGCELPRLRDDLEARIKDHEMVVDFVGKEIGLNQPFPTITAIGAVMWLAEYYKEQTVILKQVRELKEYWDKKPGMSDVHDDLDVALEYEEPSDD